MYLSLLHLDPASTEVLRDIRDPHALHCRVMRAFPTVLDPEEKPRAHFGVLHRLEDDRKTGQPLLYVQSRMKPDWSFLPAGYARPVGVPNPAVKDVGPVYERQGRDKVLRFRIRANPTRKVDTKSGPDGVRRNGRRVPVSGPDAYLEWLRRKGEECGFEVLRAAVAAAGAGELVRSHSTGRTFQGVLFEGHLVIRDAERFRAALEEGVGPGKAYGFGLLSIGPA